MSNEAVYRTAPATLGLLIKKTLDLYFLLDLLSISHNDRTELMTGVAIK